MKRPLLLVILLLATGMTVAVAQSRTGSRKSASKVKGKSAKGQNRPTPAYSPATAGRIRDDKGDAPPVYVAKVRLKKPVLVYYEEAPPGKSVQQLIMAEEHLGLLKSLDLEHLMSRREVFFDGLGNLALPGSDLTKFRLLGTSAVAESTRRPTGDGRSFYSRLKVPASGILYVVRESAEEYRHFVKGPQKHGALLDFQTNGLPGVDSVRALYTLRKMDLAERGAGSGEAIR